MKLKKDLSIENKNLLETVIQDIQKQFGNKVIRQFGNDEENLFSEIVSSGSLLLNQALGVGGYPKGRIVEIYGPEASGKTTLGLQAIAEVQKEGGNAAFLDVEHALNPQYAQNLGVNLQKLIVSQPDYGEQAFEILELLIRSNLIALVVLDSVAALIPKTEWEGEMTEQTIGLQARLMSKALRKLNTLIAQTKTVVIFTNQLREKIGVVFGNPETTPGGRALRFYASIRLEVRRGETIIENGEIIGNKIKLKVIKNKVAPPFKSITLTLNYHSGINFHEEILELALSNDLVQKNGPWYTYELEKIGHGRKATIQWLESHPMLTKQLQTQIFEGAKRKEETPKS